MKLTQLKSAPVAFDLDADDCGLPMAILSIIESFTTKNSLGLSRVLTQDYMNCTGLGKKLLNNEWGGYVVSFPWLVVILVLTVLLPLICVIWCVWQLLRKRRRRFERAPIPMWRYILSATLFVLKIIFAFFLWFTYTSFQNHPEEHSPVVDDDVKNLGLFYDRTLDMADHVFTDNVDVMQDFMTELAEDMRSSLNASAPDIFKSSDNSILHKINTDSAWFQPLLKDINEDMEALLLDNMQLLDITRHFYRNTTLFMNMGNISDPKYSYLLYNEIEANYHKTATFLKIEKVLKNINEIMEMSAGLSRLRETFAKGLDDLCNYYALYLGNVWADKVKEMDRDYAKLVGNVNELRSNLRSDVTIRLPKDVYSYQLLFIIIVTMISILCWAQLAYAFYHTVYMKFKKKKYLLVCIIVLICMSSVILCLIASHSLFVGTSFYNFRQLTYNHDNPCDRDTKSYCDVYNKFYDTRNDGSFAQELEQIKKDMDLKNQHIFEIIRAALPNVASISNILQLSAYTNFMGKVFNSGAMFNVVKQELNMENFYEVYEQLNSHISHKVATNSSSNETPYYENMLICNLNMMKTNVFENLMAQEIMSRVNRLSKNTEILAASLPMKDLGTLMRKTLDEMRAIHDFIELDFKKLLDTKTDHILTDYDMELMLYNSHILLMPNCQQFKLPGVGMPRKLYECIETCLHGFWIGAFALLILLFPILIICMILTFLYDKYPYSTQGGTNTSSPATSGGSSPTSSTTATPPNNESPAEEETESGEDDPDLRNKYAPRVKRSHVTFNASPTPKSKKKPTVSDYLTNKRRSSTAKINYLINSVIKSGSNAQPEASVEDAEASSSTQSSTNPSIESEEASEENEVTAI